MVVAAGIRGEVSLAEQANLRLSTTGLIEVNERLETSEPDIYAAGDCAESLNIVTKSPFAFQLGSIAVRQGIIAGANAAGSLLCRGFVGATAFKVFGLEVANAGLTSQMASRYGFHAVSSKVTASIKAKYMPSAQITIKLTADRDTHQIIGVQEVGDCVNQQVSLAVMAMHRGLKVVDLAFMKTCYAPAVAAIWSPLSLAA